MNEWGVHLIILSIIIVGVVVWYAIMQHKLNNKEPFREHIATEDHAFDIELDILNKTRLNLPSTNKIGTIGNITLFYQDFDGYVEGYVDKVKNLAYIEGKLSSVGSFPLHSNVPTDILDCIVDLSSGPYPTSIFYTATSTADSQLMFIEEENGKGTAWTEPIPVTLSPAAITALSLFHVEDSIYPSCVSLEDSTGGVGIMYYTSYNAPTMQSRRFAYVADNFNNGQIISSVEHKGFMYCCYSVGTKTYNIEKMSTTEFSTPVFNTKIAVTAITQLTSKFVVFGHLGRLGLLLVHDNNLDLYLLDEVNNTWSLFSNVSSTPTNTRKLDCIWIGDSLCVLQTEENGLVTMSTAKMPNLDTPPLFTRGSIRLPGSTDDLISYHYDEKAQMVRAIGKMGNSVSICNIDYVRNNIGHQYFLSANNNNFFVCLQGINNSFYGYHSATNGARSGYFQYVPLNVSGRYRLFE